MFQYEDFIPHLKSQFFIQLKSDVIITNEHKQVEITLIKIEKLKHTSPNPEPFSLIFSQSRKNEQLPQKIYSIKHNKMGEWNIFIVPLEPEEENYLYEAIFN